VEVAVDVPNASARATSDPVTVDTAVGGVPDGLPNAFDFADASVSVLVAVVIAVATDVDVGPAIAIAVPFAVAVDASPAFAIAVAFAVAVNPATPWTADTNANAVDATPAEPGDSEKYVVVSDVSMGSDPDIIIDTVTVVTVVFFVIADDCLTVCVIVFDVFVSMPRFEVQEVTVSVAIANARLSAWDGAEDGARLGDSDGLALGTADGDSDGLPLGASDGGALGASHLKSARSTLAPSVFKKRSTIEQEATGSAHDKSQHKSWPNDVAPWNMPSKLLEEPISQMEMSRSKEVAF
jgi:hypothetical protein